MKSMVDRKVGRDVADFVDDVQRFTETSRKRDKTWADPKNRVERRRMQNTMGYIID